MAYTKYSLTPANNNATPPDGAPEGMLPSAVNDTMRDMMAQIRDVGDGIRNGTYTMTAPVITGGSITGASGSFTSLTDSGNLTFTGTGNRITGDFSNATPANRVSIQSSTTDGSTAVNLIPNGTSVVSSLIAFANSTLTNASFGQLRAEGSVDVRLVSSYLGSGTYLPMTFYTGGSERLRIDTSGNVGIGISPTSYAGSTSNRTLQIYNSSAANAELRISNSTTGTGASVGALIQQAGNDMYVWNASNSFMSFGTNATERMRIDSSGNVGIGTSSPTAIGSYKILQITGGSTSAGGLIRLETSDGTSGVTRIYSANSGGYIEELSNLPLIFLTNGSERMRINASGFTKMSNTGTYDSSTGTYHEIYSTTGNSVACWMKHAGANGQQYGLFIQTVDDQNDATRYFLSCFGGATERATIRSNGGLANYSGNNVNLSDEREKTNISLAGSYLDKICAIPVKTFNYINQNFEEDDGLTLGVIAQDVQAVAPELVMESDWSKEKDGSKMRLSIYQTDLQYALMKCIQEQQAMIEELKQEVAALKAK